MPTLTQEKIRNAIQEVVGDAVFREMEQSGASLFTMVERASLIAFRYAYLDNDSVRTLRSALGQPEKFHPTGFFESSE